MRRGFILAEVMVSLAILAVGLLVIVRSFNDSLQANRFAKESLQATLLAQSKLDALKVGEGEVVTGDDKFEVTVQQSDTVSKDLNRVTVTVTWKSKGKVHNLEFSTLGFVK
jgi:Tfp pilus assembly protein PilV